MNESAIEYYLKKPIANWLFDTTLTKINIHRILMIFSWYKRIIKDWKMYCVIMIQRGGLMKESKIFNVKKKLGDKKNELVKHKKKQKNERKNLKLTLIWISSNKFLKTNKLENPQWNTQRNKNVSIRNEILSIFCLIPRPQTTRRKHRWMTDLIQVQDKKTRSMSSSNKLS